jgi:ribosomal protein S18 acetylase RimI-like enzyme
MLRLQKSLPEEEILRVTDPLIMTQWVTISDKDKNVISGGRISRKTIGRFELSNLFTHNMYQHNGLGSSVVSVLLQKAKKNGARTIEATVPYENTEAKKLLENFGFEEKKPSSHNQEDEKVKYEFSFKKPDAKKNLYMPPLSRL